MESTAMPATALVLDYAPPPKWYRRRRWRRVALFALLVAVIGTILWQREPLIRKAKLHYYERQCCNFTVPSGHVALEFDGQLAARLVNSGGGYSTHLPSWKTGTPAIFRPLSLESYLLNTPGPTGACVFLHRRVSAGGTAHLVVVTVDHLPYVWGGQTDRSCVLPIYRLSVPLVGWRDWRLPTVKYGFPCGIMATRKRVPSSQPVLPVVDRNTRIYSGQPDPNDSSHFTIDYITAGNPDTIDGYLLDDGTVTLKPRKAKSLLTNLWDNCPPAVP